MSHQLIQESLKLDFSRLCESVSDDFGFGAPWLELALPRCEPGSPR